MMTDLHFLLDVVDRADDSIWSDEEDDTEQSSRWRVHWCVDIDQMWSVSCSFDPSLCSSLKSWEKRVSSSLLLWNEERLSNSCAERARERQDEKVVTRREWWNLDWLESIWMLWHSHVDDCDEIEWNERAPIEATEDENEMKSSFPLLSSHIDHLCNLDHKCMSNLFCFFLFHHYHRWDIHPWEGIDHRVHIDHCHRSHSESNIDHPIESLDKHKSIDFHHQHQHTMNPMNIDKPARSNKIDLSILDHIDRRMNFSLLLLLLHHSSKAEKWHTSDIDHDHIDGGWDNPCDGHADDQCLWHGEYPAEEQDDERARKDNEVESTKSNDGWEWSSHRSRSEWNRCCCCCSSVWVEWNREGNDWTSFDNLSLGDRWIVVLIRWFVVVDDDECVWWGEQRWQRVFAMNRKEHETEEWEWRVDSDIDSENRRRQVDRDMLCWRRRRRRWRDCSDDQTTREGWDHDGTVKNREEVC